MHELLQLVTLCLIGRNHRFNTEYMITVRVTHCGNLNEAALGLALLMGSSQGELDG